MKRLIAAATLAMLALPTMADPEPTISCVTGTRIRPAMLKCHVIMMIGRHANFLLTTRMSFDFALRVVSAHSHYTVTKPQPCFFTILKHTTLDSYFGTGWPIPGHRSKCVLIWCPRTDSNRHARALASKTSVSTSFTTGANNYKLLTN